MILIRRLSCLLRNIRASRHLLLGCSMTMVLFIVLYSTPLPLPAILQMFIAPRKDRSGSGATGTAEDRRPRAFYPWIGDSGTTLNGTKPPVYGVFVLLDLKFSSYVTLRQDGVSFIERVTHHDFGFSSCHQVTKTTFPPKSFLLHLSFWCRRIYRPLRFVSLLCCLRVARWCSGYGDGLVIDRSPVRLPAVALPGSLIG